MPLPRRRVVAASRCVCSYVRACARELQQTRRLPLDTAAGCVARPYINRRGVRTDIIMIVYLYIYIRIRLLCPSTLWRIIIHIYINRYKHAGCPPARPGCHRANQFARPSTPVDHLGDPHAGVRSTVSTVVARFTWVFFPHRVLLLSSSSYIFAAKRCYQPAGQLNHDIGGISAGSWLYALPAWPPTACWPITSTPTVTARPNNNSYVRRRFSLRSRRRRKNVRHVAMV